MSENDCTSERVCSKCKQSKPLTTKFFVPDKRYSQGFKRQCRECINAKDRERYHSDLEKSRAKSRSNYHNHVEDRKRRWCEYRLKYPERVKESAKRYRLANPDKVREWKRRPAQQSNNRARYRRNLENNRAYMRNARRLYRARRKAVGGTHTPADIEAQYKAQGGKCWHCGKPLKGRYHADHLIPLSRGGSNDARNIVVSCAFCNQSKKDKLPQEWNGRLF